MQYTLFSVDAINKCRQIMISCGSSCLSWELQQRNYLSILQITRYTFLPLCVLFYHIHLHRWTDATKTKTCFAQHRWCAGKTIRFSCYV